MSTQSRFEISVPVKRASKVEAALFYLAWSALGFIASLFTIEVAARLAGLDPAHAHWIRILHIAVGIVAGYFYVYVPYLYALGRIEGRTIFITENGCGFPRSMLGMGAAQWMPWAELKSIRLKKKPFGGKELVFCGEKGRHSVPLWAVSQQDLEQMLLAAEAWAPSAVWSSAVHDYRDGLQRENIGVSGFSHTQLFEDELGKRFSAPTFVPLEPGRTLRSGTLTVNRQLAFGGFAAVYLATDRLNGTVVLKESVVPDSQNESVQAKARELFAREALMLRNLDHPGIAKVYDYFVEDDRSYIVMEYVNGINMRELIVKQGPQAEANVIKWSLAIADILTYLHEQSPPVVHRDVTPDNLVMTNLGEVKLIDFGASNQYLGTATGTLVGKHAYMPPEQIRGKSEPASDIFALGATMHYWLTGHEPIPLSSSSPAQIQPSISSAIDAIVSAATDMDLRKRTSSASALKADLENISNNKLSPVKSLH